MKTSSETPDIDSFRLLFEAAPDAIMVVDAHGIIRLNNAEAERLLEAAPGELRGLAVERLVPMSARRGHAHLREAFHDKPRRRPMGMGLSLKAVKLTGREFPVEISLAPTQSQYGAEVIVILRDVSERLNARRTERELVRAKALTRITQLAIQSRQIDELVHDAVEQCRVPLAADVVLLLRYDHHEQRTQIDFSTGALAGRVDEAATVAIGRLLLDAISAQAPVLVGDAGASGGGRNELAESAAISSLIIVPLGHSGEVTRALVAGATTAHFFTTDDLAFLEAVANILSNAQQRAEVEDKLLMSQRLESLGQLTGGVAHDFNNLLTVISGNLQILEELSQSDPVAVRSLAAANRATRRGAELTSKLLAFSRRQNLRPAAIDVATLLGSFRDLLARTLGPNIEVAVKASPRLPPVLADPGQLETALLNLAVNARDAMPEGGQLDISAIPSAHWDPPVSPAPIDAADSAFVRIDVTDSGAGMTRDTLARAFEPFFTTKIAGKGSGLGLSMVYGFAKQSQGHVTARSAPGEGTTVSLFLPVAEGAPKADSVHRTTAAPAAKSELILVVEDDSDVREVALSFLDSLGYRTLAASNLRAAQRHLRAHPDIDLVFTDVVLAADETGPKVVAELHKIKPRLPVLYTTGYARNALPLRTGLGEDVALLQKPYTRDELGLAVRRQLNQAA